MEVLVIDGVEYVKASVVAKRFRYTADYVGQLCRSGKVAAKLVGRTWYVSSDSISGHKVTRHIKTSSADKIKFSKEKIKVSRTDKQLEKIESPEKNIVEELPRIVSNRQSKPLVGGNYLTRVNWKPAKYEADEADLLPPLKNQPVKTAKLSVDLAEADVLRVKSQTVHQSKLTPEPLPSVALAGTLQVSSLDPSFETNETDFGHKNIDKPTIRTNIFRTDDFDSSAITRDGGSVLRSGLPIRKGEGQANVASAKAKDTQEHSYNVIITKDYQVHPKSKLSASNLGSSSSENSVLPKISSRQITNSRPRTIPESENDNKSLMSGDIFTPVWVRERSDNKKNVAVSSSVSFSAPQIVLWMLCLLSLLGLVTAVFLERVIVFESSLGALNTSYQINLEDLRR